ncbi:hypothetical protein J2X31_003592 [Flavobacterium arsenatis]|uniref:Uncharacterized protein n=1 Tax=Flavobacterium arsenatis TaxID=1484332 RepID=A0ABU1TUJ9_9FLAO|nr:hypothetical protein [Flavobacterium arsenatis]MDR6969559.1 hypothetical protein [Flavobacterium arsenatis]
MFTSLNTLQKIILILFSFCIVLNIYYEWDTKDEQVILNPNPWESFPKEENYQWKEAGLFELRAYQTKVIPFHKNNFWGLTYDISCEIRYKQENHIEIKDSIHTFYTNQTLSEAQSIQNAKHITSDNDSLIFSEYTFGENISFYLLKKNKGYYRSNSGLNIQFHSSYFTPKYIKLNLDSNNAILVKTNPLLVFNSNILSTSLFALGTVILLVLAVYGGYESFVFLIVLLFYFAFSDYYIWFYFVFLFCLSIFFKIKMRAITVNWLALPFVYWRTLPFVFIGLVLFIHKWEKTFSWGGLLFESLLALFYMFITWLIFYVSSTSIYTLYIYIFFKEKDVEQLKYIDFTSNMDPGNSGRRIPYYAGTIKLKDKVIPNVMMNFSDYFKAKKNKEIKISKYKTDNKGNYIFY